MIKEKPTNAQVLIEQVRLLYGQLTLGVFASLVNAAILCVMLWQVQPAKYLAFWYGAILLVNLPRYALAHFYSRASKAQADPAPWARLLILSNIASGVVWGGGAYLLFPVDSLAHEVFIAFILAGMTAGAAPLYSALRTAYAAFILPALLLFALRLASTGSELQGYMALLVLFYTLVLLISSRRINATIMESLELRFSNSQLLQTLTDAREQLEEGNKALQSKLVELEAADQNISKSNAILNAISQAQMRYIRKPDIRELFDELLRNLLTLTGSEYGFIGQVLRKPDGTPYLKSYALTNIAWNDETRAFYEQHAPEGMEFHNLDTLFGAVMRTGETVISNDPDADPRAGGRPAGHPPLNAFMGVPFYHGGDMVGMVGIANRAGGYDAAIVDELAPFLHTCANIIHGERTSASRIAAEAGLARTAAELHAIHTQIADGIATLDLDGYMVTANPAVERMFGTAAADLHGVSISRLVMRPDRERWEALLRGFVAGTAPIASIELEALRGDMATSFPLEITLSHLQLDDVNKVIAVLRDVTERKKVERLKNEFISTVSHELRTPLTSIKGSLGLLQGGMIAELPEQAQGLVNIALGNSERLGLLINDLLDIEKIESGGLKFDVHAVPLIPLLQDAANAIQGYAKRLQVSLVVADGLPDVALLGDPERVMQVLNNLLSNAVKFSREGDQVRLSAHVAGERVRIEVTDRGCGIPKEFQGHVFEKFTQADASDTRSVGGTGLGLSISKALVERMQGDIAFESTPGLGTTFFFHLPLARAA